MAPNLADDRDLGERLLELLLQSRSPLADVLDKPLAAQGVDHGQPHGTRERRAVPGVAEREAPRSLGNGLVDVVPAQHGADGRIACAESLRDGDHIGNEWEIVGGEPVSTAAHARDDLVEADQETVPLPPFSESFPEPVRRLEGGEGRRADRLAEERGHRLRARLFEDIVQRGERRLASGVEPRGRWRNVQEPRQVWPKRPLKARSPGEREGTYRRPVVGLRRRDHPPPLGLAALDVVGPRKPDRASLASEPPVTKWTRVNPSGATETSSSASRSCAGFVTTSLWT